MKLTLITALLVASGISHAQSYNIQFEAKPNLPDKTIRWVVLENVSSFCQGKMPALIMPTFSV